MLALDLGETKAGNLSKAQGALTGSSEAFSEGRTSTNHSPSVLASL